MRWHVAVVQSWSQRSQRSWSEHPPAVDFIAHSPTRARLSSSLFRTCLFSADTHPQVWPSAAQIHTGIPRCRSPSPEGGVFLVQPFWLILSIYGSRGSYRSPGQQLRLPHRSRRQNEVPVVRWRGLSTYPNRHGTCLSVIPYGRHARCGSLWCPFPAVVRPSWSTPRTRLLCEKWALCTLSYKKNAYLCKDIGGGSAISSKT